MKKESKDNIECPWKLQYDEILQQYHYINVIDNTVTFDLPCEVNYTPELIRPRTIFHLRRRTSADTGRRRPETVSVEEHGRKKTIFGKLGSMLRHRTSRDGTGSEHASDASVESLDSGLYDDETSESVEHIDGGNYRYDLARTGGFGSLDDLNSMISGLDDEFLLHNPTNLKNFAGTSITTNGSDMESVDSSESIHSYYSNLPYYYEELEQDVDLSFDKEQERLELRLQFREELQI